MHMASYGLNIQWRLAKLARLECVKGTNFYQQNGTTCGIVKQTLIGNSTLKI